MHQHVVLVLRQDLIFKRKKMRQIYSIINTYLHKINTRLNPHFFVGKLPLFNLPSKKKRLRESFNQIILLLLLVIISSCTQDFKEINTNPNSPVTIQPSLLLRQVIYDYGEQMSYEGFTAGNLLGQYTTALDFNLFDRHNLKSPQLGGNPWPIFYKNLRDNEIILDLSQKKETYCKQVKETLRAIKSRNATKIVLSRKKEIALKKFDISINKNYRSANFTVG